MLFFKKTGLFLSVHLRHLRLGHNNFLCDLFVDVAFFLLPAFSSSFFDPGRSPCAREEQKRREEENQQQKEKEKKKKKGKEKKERSFRRRPRRRGRRSTSPTTSAASKKRPRTHSRPSGGSKVGRRTCRLHNRGSAKTVLAAAPPPAGTIAAEAFLAQ